MGKHNQVFETPRKLLQAVGGLKLVEMAMNRNDSLCCGGGGGRMFAEVEEEPRLSRTRIDHAKEAGADVLATACPWCFTMLTNASKETGATGESVRVLDIAQIIEEVVR
jgi:Fe-S oxidoreductase